MMGSYTEGRSDVCTVSLTDASHSVEDSSARPGLSTPGKKQQQLDSKQLFLGIYHTYECGVSVYQ